MTRYGRGFLEFLRRGADLEFLRVRGVAHGYPHGSGKEFGVDREELVLWVLGVLQEVRQDAPAVRLGLPDFPWQPVSSTDGCIHPHLLQRRLQAHDALIRIV